MNTLGSLFKSPNWRYECTREPVKYGLSDYFYVPDSGAACLKRFIDRGLPNVVYYKYPTLLDITCERLSTPESLYLKKLWTAHFYSQGKTKIFVRNATADGVPAVVWDLQKVSQLSDPFLRRLINHLSGVEFSQDIEFALDLHNNPDQEEALRYLGYSVYAGLSDADIAKSWHIKTSTAEVIRKLFFDFSSLSKDRITHLAQLRQLAIRGDITESDFDNLKKIHDLGPLALKAQLDYSALTNEEKIKIEEYLGSSMLANLVGVHSAIRNKKDAMHFHAMVMQVGQMRLDARKTRQLEAQTELISLRAAQVNADSAAVQTEYDKEVLDIVRKSSLRASFDLQPRSLSDLEK